MSDLSDRDARRKRHDDFAVGPPIVTALSDHPILPEEGWIDRFNFRFQLGAIYDIVRHHSTLTPLTIGIYGDWGSGKTSAMRWIEGLLERWNKEGKPAKGAPKIKVLPVWFYPWKYQTREDVWRGIVAEVLLATIGADKASPERILFAVKRFGGFLGRSFVRALSSVKLKGKDPTGVLGEAELSFESVEKIFEDFHELNHPERAYLNQFESMLENWVKECLGKDERLLIFIDDLDRCLPGVTLEVLEAIKLYLNIKGLIFIVGLDKAVVESIVLDHYKKSGVGEDKGRDYLAKMFQVEVELFRMERAVHEFIEDQLDRFDIWKEQVAEEHRAIFTESFVRYAGDSPREAKRVINSAMIAARGWTTFEMGDEKPLTLTEGLQRYFVRRRLRELGRERVLASDRGNEFLKVWSDALVADPKLPRFNRLPEPTEMEEVKSREYNKRIVEEMPGVYRDLFLEHENFRPLLDDEPLGGLLAIVPFRISAEIVSQERVSEPLDYSAALVEKRVRWALRKPTGTLTSEDCASVEKLVFFRSDLTDLGPLARMTGLRGLHLGATKVSDLAPLQGLIHLQNLNIRETQVTDLAPLEGLTQLQELYLTRTEVADLAPLQGLTQLHRLDLEHTRVADLAPLGGLTQLRYIDLEETLVSDLAPLHLLKALENVYLLRTPASVEEIDALRRALPQAEIYT